MTKLLTLSLLIFYVLSGAPSIKASGPLEDDSSTKQLKTPQALSVASEQEGKKSSKLRKKKASKAAKAPTTATDVSEKDKKSSSKTKSKETPKVVALPSDFNNVFGSLLKEWTLKSPSNRPAFLPPTEIEIKDIILLLSAGYQPEVSTYDKIYLAQSGHVCNVTLPIIGNFKELEKRLFLKELRDNSSVKTLLKYFTVSDPTKEIKRSFETSEFDKISSEKFTLDTLLSDDKHRLSQIVLRTCATDESRTISTVASHNSISTKYELYKKYKDGELVPFGDFILSLNFYRHA